MDETVLLYDDLEDIPESTNDINLKDGTAVLKSVEHLYSKTGSDSFSTQLSNAANDDLDLYSELLSADNKERCEKEKQNKEDHEKLMKENETLRTENCALNTEVKLLRTENETLKTNISSLYKTAKAEIDFKNQLIVELRYELDGYIFRRKMYNNRYGSPERTDEPKYLKHSKNEGNTEKYSHHPKRETFISEHKKKKNDSELHESGNSTNFGIKRTCGDNNDLTVKNHENVTDLEKSHLNKSLESVSVSLQEGFNEFKSKQAVAIVELKNAFSSFERTQTQLTKNLRESVFKFYNVQEGNVKSNVCEQMSHCSTDEKYYSVNSLNSMNSYNMNSQQEKYFPDSKSYDNLEPVSVKRTKLSSPKKDTFQMLSKRCDNKTETGPGNSTSATRKHLKGTVSSTKSVEKFSSTLKNDVLKLYHYHNAAVPFAVKKRLNLSPFKKKSHCEKSSRKINSSLEPLHKNDAEPNILLKQTQNKSDSGQEPQNFSESDQCTSKFKCGSINNKPNAVCITSNLSVPETVSQMKSLCSKDTVSATSDIKNVLEKAKTKPEIPDVSLASSISGSCESENEQLIQKQGGLESTISLAEKNIAETHNVNYDEILDFALNMLDDEITEKSVSVQNDKSTEAIVIDSATSIPDAISCPLNSNDKEKCEEQVTEQTLKETQKSSMIQISGSKKRKRKAVSTKTQNPITQFESIRESNSLENSVNTCQEEDSECTFKRPNQSSVESPSFDASGFHCATVFSRRLIGRYAKEKEEEEEEKQILKKKHTSPRKVKKKTKNIIK